MKRPSIFPIVAAFILILLVVLAIKISLQAASSSEKITWERPQGEYWNIPGVNDVGNVKVDSIFLRGREANLSAGDLSTVEGRRKARKEFKDQIALAEKLGESIPLRLKNPHNPSTPSKSAGVRTSDVMSSAKWLVFAAFCSIDDQELDQAKWYFDKSIELENDLNHRMLDSSYSGSAGSSELFFLLFIATFRGEFPDSETRDLIRYYLLRCNTQIHPNTRSALIAWGDSKYQWGFGKGFSKRYFRDAYKRKGLPVPSFPQDEAELEIQEVVQKLLNVETLYIDGSFEEIIALARANDKDGKGDYSLLVPASVARWSVIMQFNTYSTFEQKLDIVKLLNYIDFLEWSEDHRNQEEKWNPDFKKYGYDYNIGYFWTRPSMISLPGDPASGIGGMTFETYLYAPEPFTNYSPNDRIYPFLRSDTMRLFGRGGSTNVNGVQIELDGVSGPFQRTKW